MQGLLIADLSPYVINAPNVRMKKNVFCLEESAEMEVAVVNKPDL